MRREEESGIEIKMHGYQDALKSRCIDYQDALISRWINIKMHGYQDVYIHFCGYSIFHSFYTYNDDNLSNDPISGGIMDAFTPFILL